MVVCCFFEFLSCVYSFFFLLFSFFFFNDTATTEIYTLSLHDALPIRPSTGPVSPSGSPACSICSTRSEEHTSELQSRRDLVCRLLLEKKKKISLKEEEQIRNKMNNEFGTNFELH